MTTVILEKGYKKFKSDHLVEWGHGGRTKKKFKDEYQGQLREQQHMEQMCFSNAMTPMS